MNFLKKEYSTEEIKELVNLNLTLDEAANRIHTICDAVNYFKYRGYECKYTYNPSMEFNDIRWSWPISADFTYEHNAGICSSTSCLYNRILKGDYESQGYVVINGLTEGITFNYFYQDGYYCYCDFTLLEQNFLIYITKDIEEFKTYFVENYFNFTDKEKDLYVVRLFQYKRDGKRQAPFGFSKDCNYTDNNYPLTNIYSKDIENDFILLYDNDEGNYSFEKSPEEKDYPPEDEQTIITSSEESVIWGHR